MILMNSRHSNTGHNSYKRLFEILPGISRSFSYIIINLRNKNLRNSICTAYILFRIADTIEDSLAHPDTKKDLFAQFLKILENKNNFNENEIYQFIEHTKKLENINNQERALLHNSEYALDAYFLIKEDFIRKSIYKWLSEMIKGMIIYQKKPINNFKDLDDYCYYVAGTVGHLLSEIFYFHNLLLACPNDIKPDILSFALLLQKVNIIRDIYADKDNNRFFWPLEIFPDLLSTKKITPNTLHPYQKLAALKKMLNNVLSNLRSASAYVPLLSKKDISIRYFCIVSILLAVKTLKKIVKHPNVFESNIKVSKLSFYTVLLESKASALSNMYYNYRIKHHISTLQNLIEKDF